jgi:hypothetical protein
MGNVLPFTLAVQARGYELMGQYLQYLLSLAPLRLPTGRPMINPGNRIEQIPVPPEPEGAGGGRRDDHDGDTTVGAGR